MHFVVLFLVVCSVVACAIVYVLYVTHHITIANALQDKAAVLSVAENPWAWVKAKLMGWKTIILGWVAVLVHIPNVIMTYIDPNIAKDLPWVQVFDAKTAAWISIACGILIPITHAAGQNAAASTTPNPNGSA